MFLLKETQQRINLQKQIIFKLQLPTEKNEFILLSEDQKKIFLIEKKKQLTKHTGLKPSFINSPVKKF